MALQDIVNVSITRETTGIPQPGFGVPMLLSSEAAAVFNATERARVYTAADQLETDGFSSTGLAVRAARRAFGQSPGIDRFVVGRRDNLPTRDVDLTPIAYDDTEYRVTINGETATFTSGTSATVADITAGLTTAINGLSAAVTATDNTTALSVTADAAGVPFDLVVDRLLLTQDDVTPDPGAAADLTAIRTSVSGSDEWYALITDNHSAAEIEALAAAIEATEKIFIASCADDDILSGTAGSLGVDLAASEYDRTALMYHQTPHEFPAAAWAGRCLTVDPGGETWMFKSLAGVVPSPITPTEETNLDTSNVNRYVTQTRGANITKEGRMAGGEYIDIIRFLDFVRARIRNNIFNQLINLDKIPFTDRGIAIVESEVRGVLRQGIGNRGFAADPEPTVSVPRAADVPFADKANRILPDVTFQAILAGAIHGVQVRGRVSL